MQPAFTHANRRAISAAPAPVFAKSIPVRAARLADDGSARRLNAISPVVVSGSARIAEFVLIAGLGLIIAHLYVQEVGVLQNVVYLLATSLAAAATVLIFELFDLYSVRALSSYVRNMPKVVFGWTTALAALVAGVFFLKLGPEVSRAWLAMWFSGGLALLLSTRVGIGWYLRDAALKGRLFQRACIYGSGTVTEELIAQLEADTNSSIRIAGIFDDRHDEATTNSLYGYPRLGGIDQLVEMSRRMRLDLVIVSLPLSAEKRLENVTRRLSILPADIKMPARATALRFSPRTYSHVGNVAMIDLFDKPLAGWGSVAKWLFDMVIGWAALILLAPLMALIAIAVKLDSRGPVLFRQKRYGFNNELIEVLKFRTMYVDCCDATASALVQKNDPRVTFIGKFLRKSSIDELPQLFNVVRGELSLVGPRPHALKAKAGGFLYDQLIEGYFARHKVKPGITGWAQINGWRGETDTEIKIEKRIEHDLYYIENWSVFLDLYILVKTPVALLNTSNAY